MENIRIAVLSPHDKVCTFLDNEAPKALHYYNDELHEYLKGTANTFTFKADARHVDSVHLSAGNKISFRYLKKDYYLNIVSVRRSEYEVEVTAYSMNFELLNEQKAPYKATRAMTFVEYLDIFDYEKVVTLGINEVSNKSIKHEWTGSDTMLANLFSLGNVFDAEIELIPQLNEDYSLKGIILNAYQAHTDTVQGVGTDRSDITLRFGQNISGVTKTTDVSEMYTLIYPFGKDGLTVASLDKKEYDSEGRLEYHSPFGDRNIYAVQARDRFPSNSTSKVNNRYIAKSWDYDTDNVNVLYGQALAQLKKNCVPQVKYEVDGYFDTGIGDTVTIADEEFNPPLYLKARVTEQTRSFTDPSKNKTTFDNFKELQSEIDPSLLAAMNKLIEENKTYTCSILTDNGIIFKNSTGETTLTASIMDIGKDVTDNFTITWEKDGVAFKTGKSVKISAEDVEVKAVYRFIATDSNNIIRAFYEVTVTDVTDGADARVYYLEISDNIIKRYLDNSLSVNYVDITACYRMGTSSVRYTFPGRFKIEQTVDGVTWSTLYQSATDEITKRYYLRTILGDSSGNGLGDSGGNALGNNSNDVTNIRVQLLDSSGSLIDVKSIVLLKDGEPTGVIESDKEPTDVADGQLWKYTGSGSSGLEIGTTYIRKGNVWKVFKFSAQNVEVETLSAFTGNLGTVNAGKINGVEINGSKITQTFSNIPIGDTTVSGSVIIDGYAISSQYTFANGITGGFSFIPNELSVWRFPYGDGTADMTTITSKGIEIVSGYERTKIGSGSLTFSYRDMSKTLNMVNLEDLLKLIGR
ncbi:MAG: phage tail spike protein [Muricomes sp.]